MAQTGPRNSSGAAVYSIDDVEATIRETIMTAFSSGMNDVRIQIEASDCASGMCEKLQRVLGKFSAVQPEFLQYCQNL